MKISVLICTRNRPDDIKWALPSVLDNAYPDYEVILVDQSDHDDTGKIAELYLKTHSNFRYIPTETRGKSHAVNIAISHAVGEVLAFTDDDCETGRDWVANVARIFSDATIDMVFGQVHAPSDLDDANVAVPSLYFEQRKPLTGGDIFGMGANMCFRRDLLDRVGIYDNLLGPGAPLACSEDSDFCYRAQKVGAIVVADPSLILVHRAHRTHEQWKKVLYLYGIGDGAFYTKHARCGDLKAAMKLGHRIVDCSIKVVGKQILRRKNVDKQYLSGLLHGISKSFKYTVDRQTRLYVSGHPSPIKMS